jgi:periplasmic protein TonB
MASSRGYRTRSWHGEIPVLALLVSCILHGGAVAIVGIRAAGMRGEDHGPPSEELLRVDLESVSATPEVGTSDCDTRPSPKAIQRPAAPRSSSHAHLLRRLVLPTAAPAFASIEPSSEADSVAAVDVGHGDQLSEAVGDALLSPTASPAPKATQPARHPVDPSEVLRYGREVSARIAAFAQYPELAERSNRQGTIVLQLVLDGSGGLRAATVVGGDADPVLAAAAIASVNRALPFPPAPSGLKGTDLSFRVPLRFTLKDR